MALVLKPRLERAEDGRIAAAIYVDGDDGRSLGIVGPTVHSNETEAREFLGRELLNRLDGLDASIVVDGIAFGRGSEAALQALAIDAGNGLLEKVQAPRRHSGTVAIESNHDSQKRRTK